MATHHEAAVARRKAMLHTRAMARRTTDQATKATALKEKQAFDERTKSIDAGATADAELQYGEQRNYLSRLLNDAPARYGSINKVYDDLSTRVTDIANARAEGAGQALTRLSSGYAATGNAAAAGDAGASANLESKGFTGQSAQQLAADRIGAAGRDQEALGLAAGSGQAGADNLYTLAGQAQLQKGENVRQTRIDDAQLRGQLLQTILNMGTAKTKAKSDRLAGYAKSDAAQATADATNRQTDQAEAASVRSNQTKRDVSLMIALEKFGLAPVYAKEKGVDASVGAQYINALMKLAGHAGKTPKGGAAGKGKVAKPKAKTTPKAKAKSPAKKKASAKKPARHRTAGTRTAV